MYKGLIGNINFNEDLHRLPHRKRHHNLVSYKEKLISEKLIPDLVNHPIDIKAWNDSPCETIVSSVA